MRRLIVLLVALAATTSAWSQGWVPRGPIYIYGDTQFTWENGVLKGSGTPDDPYVIEGWIIDARGHDYGIYIDGTRAHFLIRDCQIRYPIEKAGIMLSNVRNGRIEGNAVFGGRVGIHLLVSSGVVITGNAIGYCDHGIVLGPAAQGNTIYGNSVVSCGFPARQEMPDNRWYMDGRGNHWSDYRGQDLNKDGIGDTPYELVPDRYPLLEPPVELPPEATRLTTLDLARLDERGVVALAPGTLVRLVARDVGVGVDKIFYRLDEGQWLTYAEPFPLPSWAMVRMDYYAVDKLGNRERTKQLVIYLDIEPPVTRIVAGDPHYYAPDGKLWITSRTKIELKADDTSGTANIFFRIESGDWRLYTEPFLVPGAEGPHKIEYYAIDLYGNREGVQSAILWKDDSAPSTEPSTGGQPPFEPTPPGPEPQPEPKPEPEPLAALTFRITLTSVSLLDDQGVGKDWTFAYSLNGMSHDVQTPSLPLVLYRGVATDLSLSFRVTEADEAPDRGEHLLALSPPWTVATYALEIPVYEDNDPTADQCAVWQFTVEVAEDR
ncbi:right-handed parallel beta-helix repeat-containing protein [Candidatus Bipolaricaulota bacterium]|nr:right-handed parallel beta-helix repeat-containing protein [Candidatus Bipolaricaulota bacterium]